MKIKLFSLLVAVFLAFPFYNGVCSESASEIASETCAPPRPLKYDNVPVYMWANYRYVQMYTASVIKNGDTVTIYVPGMYGTREFNCIRATNNDTFGYTFYDGGAWMYFNL